MNGYDAGYYGYMYSLVFAADMWATVFEGNPLDPRLGMFLFFFLLYLPLMTFFFVVDFLLAMKGNCTGTRSCCQALAETN